jgi:hypothetical protein
MNDRNFDPSTEGEHTDTITALALLGEFFDLERLQPNFDEWTEERLANNPPRLFRLRRLIALFKAFQIAWNPRQFLAGEFIQPEQPRYAALAKRIRENQSARFSGPFTSRSFGDFYLREYFEILIEYRGRIESVLDFSNGVLEVSGFFLLAHLKAGDMNRVIIENLPLIDNILSELICPEGATFTVEQLIQNYGYPAVDLTELDIQWM